MTETLVDRDHGQVISDGNYHGQHNALGPYIDTCLFLLFCPFSAGKVRCRWIKSVAERPIPGGKARSQQSRSNEQGGPLVLCQAPSPTGRCTQLAALMSPPKALWASAMKPLPFPFKDTVRADFGNGREVGVYPGMMASALERGQSVWPQDPGLLRRRRRQPGDDRSFPEDAEGLNPWQSALDRVRGFPQEGQSPFVFVGQV
ncbi:PREDICTED: uncharacterized protein LOC108448083 isoform X2 [Corvus brachyrhynchos]|uniref:uncharacterized protein LOC108448083 isoform X2 n=1 Tax=Corvus brachyrhynchos TaxID=85066 RepID=UPI00081679BA|nr:PREDICTED: uncharacterized protein LOC108448083 isoform X2 [Corvus brachyrhynchos]